MRADAANRTEQDQIYIAHEVGGDNREWF
jgi:hypothetical protein